MTCVSAWQLIDRVMENVGEIWTLFVFALDFTAIQDYFTYFELGQSGRNGLNHMTNYKQKHLVYPIMWSHT